MGLSTRTQALCMARGRHDCWIARVIGVLSKLVFIVSDGNSVVGWAVPVAGNGRPRAQQGSVAEGDGGRRPDARRVGDACRQSEWPR